MIRNGNGQTTTSTVQVASGVDRSGAVLILGGGLLGLSFITQNSDLAGYLGGKVTQVPRMQWGPLILGALAVFLLLLLSKTGEVGGNFAVLFLAAAWVVFLLNKPATVAAILGQSSSSSTSSSTTKKAT
jgi:hypothetical protein